MPNGIEFEGRYAQVGTYPIGIEPMQFVDGLRAEKVQTRLQALQKRFEGCKVIIGVDRLDYIKGVPQKLHALEVFLAQHPEWVGKVRRPRDSWDDSVLISGRLGTIGYSISTRCRRVPESSRLRQRAGGPNQRTIRHGRIHADSLHAQVGAV